jgi:hypothetical protein
VQEVTEEELCDFWWNNPHLEFGPVQAIWTGEGGA